jgi:glycosyltransferase involved in cell wall biosynthesis
MSVARRRILMTVDAVGGVWQYAGELAAALAPLGYETTLALLGPAPTGKQQEDVARVAGVRLIATGLALDWLAPSSEVVATTARAIAKIADTEHADLVQLNQPALAGAADFGFPLVVVAHSCVATWWEATAGAEAAPQQFGWQTALFDVGLQRADAIVCPSLSFAQAVRRRYQLTEPPEVVYNGRSLPVIAGGGLADFAFTAGRLWDRGKNVATLDRAAARLTVPIKAAGPVMGPQGERILLTNLQALGSMDTAALVSCLSTRPVFVSAARYEPFGLAVLEAALAGCALVLSDIPSFRELWGEAAIFVAPDDADGFADAIDELMLDASERLRCGALARRQAQRFTPERMAAGMAAIYDRLLAGARAAA